MRVATVARRMIGIADSSADITAEIAAAKAERDTAHAEAARLLAERLGAEDFSDVERIDREVAQARWRADRAAAKLPALEARLVEARAREQAEALERHRSRREGIFRRLRTALEKAAEIQAEAVAADKEACAEIGENLVRGRLPAVVYRGFLFADLIERWAHTTERLLAPRPAPRPAKTGGTPTKGTLQHAVFLHGGVPLDVVAADPPVGRAVGSAPAKPAKPDKPQGLQHAVYLDQQTPSYRGPLAPVPRDDTPLAEGEARVAILRPGFELAGGGIARLGQIVRLPIERARICAANGAISILEPLSLIETLRGGGRT